MNGRLALVLTTLALLGTGLAGCLENPETLTAASEAEITALQHRDAVEAAARAWDPNATLGGVFSLELTEASEDIPADPNVGNGRALVWYYTYQGGEGATRAFRVMAEGRVEALNETMGADALAEDSDVGAVAVDSDAALQAAAANESFAAALAGEHPTLALGVAQMEGYAGWYLAAVSSAGGMIAIVDATSGQLVMVRDFGFHVDPPAFQRGAFAFQPEPKPTHVESEGRLDADEREVAIPFAVHLPKGRATLDIQADHDAPTDMLRWRVVDAEGETVERGWTDMAYRGEGGSKDRFHLEGPATYTLELSYASLAPVGLGGVDYALTLDVEVPEKHDHD